MCVCVFNNKQKLTHRLPAQEGQHKAAFVCLCVSMVTETTEKGTDERRELNGRGGSNGKELKIKVKNAPALTEGGYRSSVCSENLSPEVRASPSQRCLCQTIRFNMEGKLRFLRLNSRD